MCSETSLGTSMRNIDVGDAENQLGSCVTECMDVDGDGAPDLVIGAPGPSSRQGYFGVEGLGRNGPTSRAPLPTGYVVIVSTSTGRVIRRFEGKDIWFGKAVAVLRNTKGALAPTLCVGAGSPQAPVIYMFELLSGRLLCRSQL